MADELHDSYRILQLAPGASLPTVKRAYRQLVKLWHPDHFAPGSKMELKAQEKLKEINLAYEKLCKSRGQKAAADASEQSKKSRKSASPSDEEAKAPRRANSGKVGEEAVPPPGKKRPSRKMGDMPDDEPQSAKPPPPPEESEAAAPPPPPPVRRSRGFRAEPKIRQRILLAAALLAAGALLAVILTRRLRTASLKPLPDSAPVSPSVAAEPGAPVSAAATPDQAPADSAPKAAEPVPGDSPAASPVAAADPASASLAPSPAAATTAPVAATPVVAPREGAAVNPSVGMSVEPRGPAAAAPPAATIATIVPAPPAATSTFTEGSSKAEVIEIQGMPDRFTETNFQYGSSEVYFQHGHVVSWQDGNPRLKTRRLADLSAASLATFTVGSRKDEVVAVQGKPDAVTDTTFRYGSSIVIFLHDRVESWQDGSPHLKTRPLPAETIAKLDTFTVGSRKDEVVSVQGLPDKYTDATFQYGSSTIFFQNGRVVSWTSGDPPLKNQKP